MSRGVWGTTIRNDTAPVPTRLGLVNKATSVTFEMLQFRDLAPGAGINTGIESYQGEQKEIIDVYRREQLLLNPGGCVTGTVVGRMAGGITNENLEVSKTSYVLTMSGDIQSENGCIREVSLPLMGECQHYK